MPSYVDIFKLQEQELAALNQRVDELKRRYELYFLGIEKRMPGPEREKLERDVRNSKLQRTMKTELRFRFRQFLARLRTYTQYWDRTCREIEEGTYKRGAMSQAERMAALQAEAAMKRAQGLESGDAAADDDESDRIAAAARAAAAFLARGNGAAPAAQPRAPVGGVSDLYREYVEAKKARGEDTSRISYAAFAKSVERQREKARDQLGQDVDLRVKVSPDKVTLVASRKQDAAAAARTAPPPPARVPTVPPGPPRAPKPEPPAPPPAPRAEPPAPPPEPQKARRPASRSPGRRTPPPPPAPRSLDDI